MRKFLQHLLVNYALALIAITAINALMWGFEETLPLSLNAELLLVILLVRLVILLTNKFQSRWPVLEYLVEVAAVLAVVLGCGWLLGWYGADYFIQMVIIILAVYAGIYAVGFGRARRDAAFINEQIRQRRTRLAIKQKEGIES